MLSLGLACDSVLNVLGIAEKAAEREGPLPGGELLPSSEPEPELLPDEANDARVKPAPGLAACCCAECCNCTADKRDEGAEGSDTERGLVTSLENKFV